MVKHAEGEGVGRRGSDIFLWRDKGANFVFWSDGSDNL